MYVLEGATLGGAVISRNVRAVLHLGPHNGASFFASYGADVGANWKAFCEALERGLTDDASRGEAAEIAIATFTLFEACMAGREA